MKHVTVTAMVVLVFAAGCSGLPVGSAPLSPPSVSPSAVPVAAGTPTVTASSASAVTSAPASAPATTSAPIPPAPAPDPASVAPGEPGASHLATVYLPDGLTGSVAEYGAIPDDGRDDTQALQAALSDGRDDPDLDYYGRPKRLVFLPGTYEISDTLQITGCCVTFQGSGSGATVLRVPDATAGFVDAAAPRPVIRTIAGNMAFRNHVRDLTIDVGAGNPGAVGLDFIGNNSASIENVVLSSATGSGAIGLDMRRDWPGPLLVSDLTVQGFDIGIAVAGREYAPTFQRVTLRGQRSAGVDNVGNTLSIAQLRSENAVPAIISRGDSSSVLVIDSLLQGSGGAGQVSAVVADAAVMLQRVSAPGYASVVDHDGTPVPGTTVSEYVAGVTAQGPFTAQPSMLSLPIAQTPPSVQAPPQAWVSFLPSGYNEDKSKVQGLFDSGAAVVAFPLPAYYLDNVIDVPCSVERVTGFGAVINGGERRLTLRVAADCPAPLVIEDFGYGVTVEHNSGRTVAVRHGQYRYTSSVGAGPVFLEDYVGDPLVVQPGQHMWARQLNLEFQPLLVQNTGGTLWILGLKTEGRDTVIDTSAGGSTEVLGGLIYRIDKDNSDRSAPVFRSVDSRQSLWISGSNYTSGFFDTYVEETRGGVTRTVKSADTPGWRLFSGAVPSS